VGGKRFALSRFGRIERLRSISLSDTIVGLGSRPSRFARLEPPLSSEQRLSSESTLSEDSEHPSGLRRGADLTSPDIIRTGKLESGAKVQLAGFEAFGLPSPRAGDEGTAIRADYKRE
jgi:hypothetical protein